MGSVLIIGMSIMLITDMVDAAAADDGRHHRVLASMVGEGDDGRNDR